MQHRPSRSELEPRSPQTMHQNRSPKLPRGAFSAACLSDSESANEKWQRVRRRRRCKTSSADLSNVILRMLAFTTLAHRVLGQSSQVGLNDDFRRQSGPAREPAHRNLPIVKWFAQAEDSC
eukprot:9997785-Alexandrium_andersonii.AAC.1